MAKALEQIPARPFREWLEKRYAYYEKQCTLDGSVSNDAAKGRGAAKMLAVECGWPGDAGVRKLYRLRNELRAGSVDGVKCEYPTGTYARETVEEALHHAGVPFFDLYPGLDDDLEPLEGACVKHGERVFLDALGECQWCAGEREFAARLARRARDQRYKRAHERKQAA